MPYLRVAHLASRQAYGQAGSAEGCSGIILPESLQVRLAGPGYGIARLDWAYAEAVHDDDCYWLHLKRVVIRANILDLLFFEPLNSYEWNEDHAHLLLHNETVIRSCHQEQLLAVAADRQDHLAAHT